MLYVGQNLWDVERGCVVRYTGVAITQNHDTKKYTIHGGDVILPDGDLTKYKKETHLPIRDSETGRVALGDGAMGSFSGVLDESHRDNLPDESIAPDGERYTTCYYVYRDDETKE